MKAVIHRECRQGAQLATYARVLLLPYWLFRFFEVPGQKLRNWRKLYPKVSPIPLREQKLER